MKCPDCQGGLNTVSLTGFDESYRCSVCGGFWMQGWAFTQAGDDKIDQWSRFGLRAHPELFTGKCPKDGATLKLENSELIPESIQAKKCPSCGWWWMAGDSLFDYRSAIATRKNYEKWWGKPAEVLMMFAPAILVMVMAVGLAYGVNLVRQRTQISIAAKSSKIDFRFDYQGGGRAMLEVFSSEPIYEIQVVKQDQTNGLRYLLTKEGGAFKTMIEGLEDGGKYVLKIKSEVFEFTAE